MSLLNHTSPVQLNALTNGFGDFTTDLYQQYVQSTNENVIFSPVSILNALVLLSTAANGITYEQMRQSLYLNNNKTFTANLFHEYNEFFHKNNEKTTLLLANQIYVDDCYTLNKSFQEVATKMFSCGVESVDFGNSTQAARTINDFVEEKTNKKIKNFIEPSSIDEKTAVMLINSLYFESNWKYPFNCRHTTAGDFYVNENETIRVDFMKKRTNLFGHKNVFELKASVLEMKYANTKYSFIILLPWDRTGLSTLETKLKNFDIAKEFNLIRSSKYKLIDVKIPKFKIEMTIMLNDILKKLGMVDMFNPLKADFREMLETSEKLYVSDVLHKAFIDINEGGTEAAASSSVTLVLQSYDGHQYEFPKFHADHPFIYYIWNTEIKSAIFMGRVTKFG